MRNTLIRRGLPSERILLITNGVDTTKFCPMSLTWARSLLGWDDRFTVLYAGTHGLSHGLITVLNAAEQFRDRDDIRFVLVGDGADKVDLIARARNRGLKNVEFLDSIPHEQMPQLLAAASVCLAHARKVQLFEGMLPIKMIEAMACARPVLLALNGEARRIAEQEAAAAIYVEPENASSLISAILYLHEHPEEAEQLGQRGRIYVEEHFDYDQLTAALDARIETLLNNRNIPISMKVTPLPDSIQATPEPVGAVAKEK
jgi:glycosyltransferase involved in cell wall biosynthesis